MSIKFAFKWVHKPPRAPSGAATAAIPAPVSQLSLLLSLPLDACDTTACFRLTNSEQV